jgi:hypothetical protein
MKEITKSQIVYPHHLEILRREFHHNHELVLDRFSTIRWKPDDRICSILSGLNFNNVVRDLISRGIDKNCEEYRKVYRDIGYSLDGYWELFYLEVNNPISSEYKPNEK